MTIEDFLNRKPGGMVLMSIIGILHKGDGKSYETMIYSICITDYFQ